MQNINSKFIDLKKIRKISSFLVFGLIVSLLDVSSANAQSFSLVSLASQPAYSYEGAGQGERGIAMSDDGQTIIVADQCRYWGSISCSTTRYLQVSRDGGSHWTAIASVGSNNWMSVSISASGQYMTAAARFDYSDAPGIYFSKDYGITWLKSDAPDIVSWWDLQSTTDGRIVYATVDGNDYIYKSSDYGATWEPLNSVGAKYWRGISVSGNGTTVIACNNAGGWDGANGGIYVSQNAGTSFTQTVLPDEVMPGGAGAAPCGPLHLARDGSRFIFSDWNGYVSVYKVNTDLSWSRVGTRFQLGGNWVQSASISADGQVMFATDGQWSPYQYTFSTDGGLTFTTESLATPDDAISSIDISADGSKAIVVSILGGVGIINFSTVQAPAFTLSSTSEIAKVGTPINGYTINSTGGAITSFTIEPAIGNGLSFNSSTGIISGTPTASSGPVLYTITARNATSPDASRTFLLEIKSDVVPVNIPDPIQLSKILEITPSVGISGQPLTVTVTGTFIEKITSIQINSVPLSQDSWIQKADSVTFKYTPSRTGSYSVQIYNGSAPVLMAPILKIESPIVNSTMKTATRVRNKYIRCSKPGKRTKIIRGTNPVCPDGYVKQV